MARQIHNHISGLKHLGRRAQGAAPLSHRISVICVTCNVFDNVIKGSVVNQMEHMEYVLTRRNILEKRRSNVQKKGWKQSCKTKKITKIKAPN